MHTGLAHAAICLHRASQFGWPTARLVAAGYLPSFWVKLRVLAVPALDSTAVHNWPARPLSILQTKLLFLYRTAVLRQAGQPLVETGLEPCSVSSREA